MDLIQFPIGSFANADISLAGGSVVLSVKISAQAEIDALLNALAQKDPALAPLIAVLKAGIDSALT